MTETKLAAGPYCGQHHRPLSECEPWDKHGHSNRFRKDDWQATERAASDAKLATTTTEMIAHGMEVMLGYLRCSRGACRLDAPPVPVVFGDLAGKTLGEWIAEAAKEVERQHPAHEPVRIGARPSARSGEGKDAAKEEKPPAARTEPPAPVPAQRRGNGRKETAEPPLVAADGDVAATLASLRARIDQLEDSSRSRAAVAVVPDVTPATAVFMEPGGEAHVPYESPDRSRKRRRANCSHHVPAGTRCKICEPRT